MASNNKITVGTTEELRFGKFKMDRQGLVTGTVMRRVQEPYDAPNWAMVSILAAPALDQPCVDAERDYDFPKGMAIYTYTYEGVGQSFIPDDNFCTFELDLTMSEEPIETHPNFLALKTKYGWNIQKRQFQQQAPGGTTGSTGLSGTKKAKKSPLYGVDSYLAIGGSFRKSYVTRAMPSGLLYGIGTIVAQPPGLASFPLPSTAAARNWLKLAPKVTRRGNCVQVSEQWLMSGPNGWVKDIYSATVLQETGGGGLSITGL